MASIDEVFEQKHKLVMYLMLVGITMLFTALCVSYMFSKNFAGFQGLRVPLLFYVNSLFLVLSSYFYLRANKGLKNRKFKEVKNGLTLSTLATLAFLVFQVVAWWQLFDKNIVPSDGQNSAYLYLISILHFLHVVGGIIFLVVLLVRFNKAKNAESQELLISDEKVSNRIWSLGVYTHFLDIMWLVLVLFFVVNFL